MNYLNLREQRDSCFFPANLLEPLYYTTAKIQVRFRSSASRSQSSDWLGDHNKGYLRLGVFRGLDMVERRHGVCKTMGAAILFPKFLRIKLRCISWFHRKQNGCPASSLVHIRASRLCPVPHFSHDDRLGFQ